MTKCFDVIPESIPVKRTVLEELVLKAEDIITQMGYSVKDFKSINLTPIGEHDKVPLLAIDNLRDCVTDIEDYIKSHGVPQDKELFKKIQYLRKSCSHFDHI